MLRFRPLDTHNIKSHLHASSDAIKWTRSVKEESYHSSDEQNNKLIKNIFSSIKEIIEVNKVILNISYYNYIKVNKHSQYEKQSFFIFTFSNTFYFYKSIFWKFSYLTTYSCWFPSIKHFAIYFIYGSKIIHIFKIY